MTPSFTPARAALFLLIAMIAVIAVVLAFQHVGGFIPCKLCLQQRQPYYFAMPLAALALANEWRTGPAWISRSLLAATGLLLLTTTALAAYHAGVEWNWWEGPADCGATSGNISGSASDLLEDLARTLPPACDEAAGRFLGLSFAGWNVLAGGFLAIVAFAGATRK